MAMRIFLFISMYPILFILYFVMKNEAQVKSGMAYGIPLPGKEEHPEFSLKEDLKQIEEAYKKEMKRYLLILAIIPIVSLFIPWFSISFTIWMIWTFVMVGLFFVPFIRANIKVKQILQQHGIIVDEKGWKWGIFYKNKEDKHILVTSRMGTGQTFNMAKPVGIATEILVVLTVLAIPVLCVWMMMEEFVPISITIEENTLVAHQWKDEYEIPVDSITNVELIQELPRMSKSNGSAMDELDKGTFYIRNVGKCEVFLNPKNTEFITFEADGMLYYMSDAEDAGTEEIYKELRTAE